MFSTLTAAILTGSYAVLQPMVNSTAFGMSIGESVLWRREGETSQTAQRIETVTFDGSIGDEISRLLEAGNAHIQAEADREAIATYRQALVLIELQSPVNLGFKAEALQGLGTAYQYLGEYEQALPSLEAALALYQDFAAEEIPGFDLNRLAESDYAVVLIDLLGQLGMIHNEQANFATALTYYHWGLMSEYPEIQAVAQHNIGAIEAELAQYEQAEETLLKAIALSQAIEDIGLEASAVVTIGWVYELQKKYAEAIASYEAAIELFQRTDEPSREARAFNNLGVVHLKQGDLAAAQAALDNGFALVEAAGDSYERAVLLNSLGSFYQESGETEQAWRTQLQALQLSKQTGDAIGEIEVLLNLGGLMEAQDAPEVAIFFYKDAIANIENIRQDLRQLSQSVQQRYTLTIEDVYRHLADLLLQQGRAAEALHILDLLKLQEVKAYLRDRQTEGIVGDDRLNTPAELALAEEVSRWLEDMSIGIAADISLAAFLEYPVVVALREAPAENIALDLQAVKDFQAVLQVHPMTTAVLYPLILDDRLEIILITPEGVVENFAVPVTQTQLSTTVGELTNTLKNAVLDPRAPAQRLYSWLILPLEEQLTANGIENLIYLPDGLLRYVPLAALHDGEKWLAEKYQSHNITAAQVDDLLRQDLLPLSVLAGAFTDSSLTHQVKVGPQSFAFNGLSAAEQEIDNLAARVPDTVRLLDSDFTVEETLSSVGDRTIVHLATHAKFVPGQPEESFILFGDGGTVNLRDIREWRLPGVDLVVLSACQTASSAEGEGKEILGLGFQVQQTGAASVIASLWAVDDTSTAALMTQFYQALSEGQSKAQALRSAQVKLIESVGYAHPHDWAAFILIGNGL